MNDIAFYTNLEESFACLPFIKISNLQLALPFSKTCRAAPNSISDLARTMERQTGIKERRYAKPEEAASSLAIKALKHSAVTKKNITALLVATTSGDYPSPATANFVHAGLGLHHSVHCLDIASSCSSFLSALRASVGFLNTNAGVLVTATEVKHKSLVSDDFRSISLFADGAGGIYLTQNTIEKQLPDFFLFTYQEIQSTFSQDICIPVGGSREPVNEKNFSFNKLRLQNPKTLYFHTVKSIVQAIETSWLALQKLQDEADTQLASTTIIFVHQANKNIIKEVKKRLSPEIAKLIPTLMSDLGNMVSASLPVLRTRVLFLRTLFYYKNKLIPYRELLQEFTLMCKNKNTPFSYEKKEEGILFLAQWQNEKISIFDDGCVSLEESWLARLDPDEYEDLARIFCEELAHQEKKKFADIWIAAGGGFQTLGMIHGKKNTNPSS